MIKEPVVILANGDYPTHPIPVQKLSKAGWIICCDGAVNSMIENNMEPHVIIGDLDSIDPILKSKYKNIQRVILARELSLPQIKSIIQKLKKTKIKVDIETFIHGAMCVSISGRCFLSQEIFNKSANRGECIQPCRRKYLIKDVEENHEYELGEDYILSPNDLCTIEILDKLVKAGIKSFKIEGRNRSPEYVKTVTEVYREVLDKKYNKNNLLKKLKTVYHRGFSTGFYLGKPVNEWTKAYGSKATKKKVYVGVVKHFYTNINVAEIKIETKGIKINDNIMFQGNKTGVKEQKVISMQINKKEVKQVKKGQSFGLKTKSKVRENDKVYLILWNFFKSIFSNLNLWSKIIINKRISLTTKIKNIELTKEKLNLLGGDKKTLSSKEAKG